MRVLFWQTHFWPEIGGAEVLGSCLVEHLAARGHEMLVVASQADPALPADTARNGIPVLRFPFAEVLQRRDVAAIGETLRGVDDRVRSFRPEVVHVNSQDSDLFFLHRSGALRRLPWLLTIHSSATLTCGANSLMGRTVARAAWVACVSGAMRADTVSFLPEAADRCSVVLDALPDPAGAGTRAAPLPSAPTLLAFGRLVPEKGFDIAVDALARLDASVRLVIAGDGVARVDLERRAAAQGLSRRVTFTGWVPPERVPDLVDSATLVLVPSRWREPFGLVALQAAQRGRPVVASRAGGLPEIVVDGETGLLAEASAESFAARIEYLLSRPEDLARMGGAARERAATVFRFERLLDDYERLYRRVAGRGA